MRQACGPAERLSDPFWTLSNLFSMARIALVPLALYLLWLGDARRWEALGVILTMVATDWLDGYFARRRGEITRWGKILDPLADKVAIDSIAVALSCLKGLPAWIAAAIVGRDIVIVLAGVFLVARKRIVVSSNVWGKWASGVMTMLFLAYMLDLHALKVPLLVLGAAMILASLSSYGMGFLRRVRTR